MITLEQYGPYNDLYYFIDHVNFIDYLINSSIIIELLRHKEINEHVFIIFINILLLLIIASMM